MQDGKVLEMDGASVNHQSVNQSINKSKGDMRLGMVEEDYCRFEGGVGQRHEHGQTMWEERGGRTREELPTKRAGLGQEAGQDSKPA